MRIGRPGMRRRASSAARTPSSLDGGGDLEAHVAQEADEAVAQEREVLGDHDAHGSSALIVVGPPAGLWTVSEPSSASMRRLRPVSPLPAASAPPAPSS